MGWRTTPSFNRRAPEETRRIPAGCLLRNPSGDAKSRRRRQSANQHRLQSAANHRDAGEPPLGRAEDEQGRERYRDRDAQRAMGIRHHKFEIGLRVTTLALYSPRPMEKRRSRSLSPPITSSAGGQVAATGENGGGNGWMFHPSALRTPDSASPAAPFASLPSVQYSARACPRGPGPLNFSGPSSASSGHGYARTGLQNQNHP